LLDFFDFCTILPSFARKESVPDQLTAAIQDHLLEFLGRLAVRLARRVEQSVTHSCLISRRVRIAVMTEVLFLMASFEAPAISF
jgi:hypothetical protein